VVVGGHHPLTLCGLSQVLEQEGGFAVLAVATDVEAILEAIRRHQPSIVILDLDRDGTFRLLRRLRRQGPVTRVIVLTAAADYTDMLDTVRIGARAVIRKELAPDEFVACIRNVHRGERSVDGATGARSISDLFNAGTAIRRGARQLTPREAEIARIAVLGISTREIADRLDVKQGTVKIHLHSIYDKLNVGGRLGLVLFARRHGLA
jgi:DNA-binding NarL/FixJ family response regulator